MAQNQYDVSKYSDEELYNILELNPAATDNELEARLIQQIQRHMYLNTTTGRKLFKFFKDIYEHFFDIERNDDEKTDASYTMEELEKYDYDESDIKAEQKRIEKIQNQNPPSESAQIKFGNEMDTTTSQNVRALEGNQLYTKELDYTKGKVNPILKETYKRIITIDSQYREEEYLMSTDFTINLSEILKNVVSLKLYAVQLPVTWYTISESYGSNIFYLKPALNEEENVLTNTLAIANENHEYKVEIDPGNYTSASLISEVNTKMEELRTTYPDVSFGNTKIDYNTSQAKSTFIVDIQKIYKEFCYDVSYSNELRDTLFERVSSPTEIVIDHDGDNVSWNTTGTFVFIEYLPTVLQNTFSLDDNLLTEINRIEIPLPIVSSPKTADEWVALINEEISGNILLDKESNVSYIESVKQFRWNLKPNRHSVQPLNGTQWVLERPTGENSTNFGTFTYNEARKKLDANTNTYIRFSEAQEIRFIPKVDASGGIYIDPDIYGADKAQFNDIVIRLSEETTYANIQEVYDDLNHKFQSNPLLHKTQIYFDAKKGAHFLQYNINKIYTTRDYKLVFYDISSFSRCLNPLTGFRNAKIDTTLGFILGFKALAEYELKQSNVMQITNVNNTFFRNPDTGSSTKSVYTYNEVYDKSNVLRTQTTLKGNSVVTIFLYNYFMIILDDFKQNHLNDGLVTLTPKDTGVTLPSYASRKSSRICNPNSFTETNAIGDTTGLTQKQIYSVEQILETQNKTKALFNDNVSVKDMFALIPVKSSGSTPGSIYVEFGGTLQQQERTYFGPVDIGRIAVKLVNDKGDVVDLNGGNWSFQLVCEQLYVREPTVP